MGEVAHIYTKVRTDFGKHCNFKDEEPTIMKEEPSEPSIGDDYIQKNPCIFTEDSTRHMSVHEVNTERVTLQDSKIMHVEGGWPKDVEYQEQADVNRFRKKAEKQEDYQESVQAIRPIIDCCMKQNNTIDIYEKYFDGVETDHSGEPPTAKGLAVFRDPEKSKRSATSINWHPEGPTKIAVSYSVLNFQDSNQMTSKKSFIWDVHNPNIPDTTLCPSSPLCCLRFNHKATDTVVGGSYNGLISYYDLRKGGGGPAEESLIEHSHHDPVYDVFWTSSKSASMCVSVSTDGMMLWWDTRKLKSGPTEKLMLSTDSKGGGSILGGSSLEFNQEAGPTKYLVGTEQGVVLGVNLRNKKTNNGVTVYDTGAGKHHGPIYAIQRNLTHSKFFLTVGDWTARIWMEDLKTPIMTTKYHGAYLTGGCWSPTRTGVFFVTRMDGVVDIWDYFYRQNEVAYSHKVGDEQLSSIAVSAPYGREVAVGDINGTVSLLELCDSLARQQPNEKQAILNMLERETKQEKNLEAREKELRRARKEKDDADKRRASDKKDGKDEKMEELLRKVDADFLQMIKEAEDDESKQSDVKTK
uniref:Dynein intermediate chain 3, ciliary n=1 Tax=Octactis speculum TaxID=3111310 RepID=A0A7S2FLW6_9STRA|mmetsp:Transcript_25605/g.35186  ORF Transcript_25605/g.35186 Transcript_25605/m.35186 type:complete len:580 (+) Transcript_25605:115-1854(+)